MRTRIETAKLTDGETTWWAWGIYAKTAGGYKLIVDSGQESYATKRAANEAAKQYRYTHNYN